MRAVALSVLLAAAAGCARGRDATLVWEGAGPPRVESAAALSERLAPVGPGVRRGTWGESVDATFQALDSVRAEEPHVHARHDLTVVLLRGHGVLVVEGRRYALTSGDVVHVLRGRVHAFAPQGNAVALAIFTPPLDGIDYVPAGAMRNPPADAP